LRDTRKQIATLAQRVHEAEAERDRYNRLYARGKLTDAEYNGYTNELDEKRNATEEELARPADARRHVEYLEELPQLVEEYLRDLPDLVEGPGPRSESTRPCHRSASGPSATARPTRCSGSRWSLTTTRAWRSPGAGVVVSYRAHVGEAEHHEQALVQIVRLLHGVLERVVCSAHWEDCIQ
jgi:hypothetical protein